MVKIAGWMRSTFFNKTLELRVRLFNLLAMAGAAVSLIAMLLSPIVDKSIVHFITYTLYLGLSLWLLWFSYKTGRYQLCYTITIVAIFMVGFSWFYFIDQIYYGSIPYYFIFAIVFTSFMLEGKKAVLVSLAELLLYIGICLFSYYCMPFVPNSANVWSVMLGFIIVSLALGATMLLQFKIYNTQREELEEARKMLTAKNDTLEALDKLKTEFLSDVTHELKTPLTVVSGYAQIAALQLNPEDEKDAAVAETMKIIKAETERLALMVGRILDLTHIEEKKMLVVEPAPCCIKEIIHQAIDIYYPVLNKNNNNLQLRLEDDLLPVLADAARISQVLVNLVSNAARFTVNGQIEISAIQRRDYVAVTVADTGVGISQTMLPHVFERYVRTSGGAQGNGTGLGLFICKQIIAQHSGQIEIQSEEGKGTRVTFTLPCVKG
ncbi:MAG: sensor histidine kinase [Oscillospiraceae bacterium]